MKCHRFGAIAALCLLPALGGCAGGAGFAILSQSAGNVAASGVERSMDGASIKTYTADRRTLATAARAALAEMGFDLNETRESESSTRLLASSEDRTVAIHMERVARNATRVRVEVDDGYIFFSDAPTSTELMSRIAKALDRAGTPPS